jgi:cellulose synthase/poly-beta-1,6-N-acetylglucosamine synthase-like glycosyltransferase
MLHAFYLILSAIVIVATLPLVLELLIVTSALFIPRRKASGPASRETGPLTIVVPAHNEELLIGRCVSSLLASANGAAKILVVAHNCTDKTATSAFTAGAEVLPLNDPGTRGKGHALRFGLQAAMDAGAEAVAVVDADSTVSTNFVPMVRQALGEGADAIQCRYEMKSVTDKPSSGLASLAFRGFTFLRPLGRERLGLSAGILGNGFALTAKTLREVPYEAFSVVEDVEYHMQLLRAGKRVRFVDYAVVSAELPESQAGEVSQRSRWEGGRFRVARMWTLPLLGQILRGHFALIEPLLDLTGMPLAFGVSGLIAACLIPVPIVRMYGLFSMALVVTHVLLAAWAGPHFFKTLRLLAMSPLYILWKFRLIPKLLRASQSEAAWVRTSR